MRTTLRACLIFHDGCTYYALPLSQRADLTGFEKQGKRISLPAAGDRNREIDCWFVILLLASPPQLSSTHRLLSILIHSQNHRNTSCSPSYSLFRLEASKRGTMSVQAQVCSVGQENEWREMQSNYPDWLLDRLLHSSLLFHSFIISSSHLSHNICPPFSLSLASNDNSMVLGLIMLRSLVAVSRQK